MGLDRHIKQAKNFLQKETISLAAEKSDKFGHSYILSRSNWIDWIVPSSASCK